MYDIKYRSTISTFVKFDIYMWSIMISTVNIILVNVDKLKPTADMYRSNVWYITCILCVDD